MTHSKNQPKSARNSKHGSPQECAPSATPDPTVWAKARQVGIAQSAQKPTESIEETGTDSRSANVSPTPSTPAGASGSLRKPGTLSRQRLWQIKKAAEGKCIICGVEVPEELRATGSASTRCAEHIRKHRAGCSRYYRNNVGKPEDTPKMKAGRPRIYNV